MARSLTALSTQIVSLSVLLSMCKASSSFNVVGWYVGKDEKDFPLESIRWDVYSTIRCGYVAVDPETWSTSCSKDPFFKKCLAIASEHGKGVTLGPGPLDVDACILNETEPSVRKKCETYVSTLGAAVRSCGPGITGVEIDHEGGPGTLGSWGIVNKKQATAYSLLLDGMQKSMGGNYTVSADIGVWGLDNIWGLGGSYLLNLFTPWVDAKVFKANPNLFVNTMSYHTPRDCSIRDWKWDGYLTNKIWGIPKAQINIGIGYFSFNITNSPRKIKPVVANEPTWQTLSKLCPKLAPEVCMCEGVTFVSKQMNYDIGAFVKAEGYRGVFPWAANYDSPVANESHAVWLGRGMGLIA